MLPLFQDDAPEVMGGTVSVLVPLPVEKAYSYAVPAGQAFSPGQYVTVPLGSRQVPGVVWDSDESGPPSKKLKAVVSAYDVPPMPAAHRRFLDWVAQYNMAPLGAVLKMALPVPAALNPPESVTGYALTEMVQASLITSPSPRPSPHGGEGGRAQARPGEGAVYRQKPPELLMDRARDLRRNQTDVEQKLWLSLRNRRMENKFRRQHPVPPYVVDFVCIEKKLIIELDGSQHQEQKTYDDERTKFLEAAGYRVIRFWNNEILQNIEGVLHRIDEALSTSAASGTFLENLSPPYRSVVSLLSDGRPRRAAEIAEAVGCTPGVLKTMVKKNLLRTVEIYGAAPCRHPDIGAPGPSLSAAQAAAADTLCRYVREGRYQTALLDGVTGAGKTEVYFEAVAEALKTGKQALILLPEIALSNAFLDRFKSRFGCAPALWHSALSPAQRKNTWRGIVSGETKVVVGARSALFLPYADLGVIIVDEEHDPAYKQEDGVIYHARDMAVVRAHLGKIPVVLVSATPSLETITNAWSGRYEHLHLPDRHAGASMPDVHVIDMKKDKPDRHRFIAPSLREKLRQNLEMGEQSLLFLNRRGYAPLTLCRACGQRLECPRCTAWLVEHRRTNRLECHHCGYGMKFPSQCPSCGEADSLHACGPGVERIVEEVKEYFPEARTFVLASDTAGTQEELRQILSDIRDHRCDIIVGTQIIAKGHHFPMLTLVGVVDADLGLKGGDLRAAERTFQLLHQVGGRAGREERSGHVYLQTWLPENKVMKALAIGDRDRFLEIESAEREGAFMPPFSRLAGIIISGKDEKQVADIAAALGRTAPHTDGVRILGPAESPFYRLRGNYRRRLLVQAEKNVNLQKLLEDWMAHVKTPSSIRVYIDIDPQSFL